MLDDIAWRQEVITVHGEGNQADRSRWRSHQQAARPLPRATAARPGRRTGRCSWRWTPPRPSSPGRGHEHRRPGPARCRISGERGRAPAPAYRGLRRARRRGRPGRGRAAAASRQPEVTAVYARSDITALRRSRGPGRRKENRGQHGPARGRGRTWPRAAPAAAGSRVASSCSDRSWTAWKPAAGPGSRCPPRSRRDRPGRDRPGLARPAARGRPLVHQLRPALDPAAADPVPAGLIPAQDHPPGPLSVFRPGDRPAHGRGRDAPVTVLAASMRTLIGLMASAGIRSGSARPRRRRPGHDGAGADGHRQVRQEAADRAAPLGRRRALGLPAVPEQHAATAPPPCSSARPDGASAATRRA